MDEYKPVPVVFLPHLRFIGVTTRHVRTGSVQGSWDPERSASIISTVGIPVEEALADIGIKIINVVIHMECDGESSWVKSLGELWPTEKIYQWVYWLTNP